jgi:hypothetical protein
MKETTSVIYLQVGDNIEMDLKEIGFDGVNRIYLFRVRTQWRGSVNMKGGWLIY